MHTKHLGSPWAWSAAVAVAMMLCSQPAFGQQGQDANAPAKPQNGTWYDVQEFAFKPDKLDSAMTIANKYILPADKAAGIHVMELIHVTGPWNVTVIGISDAPPFSEQAKKEAKAKNAAFHKALVKLAGSDAKAKELDEQFGRYIDHFDRYIARSPMAPPSGGN